jgi:glycosyltransferase involved in cell wall biosynthesis
MRLPDEPDETPVGLNESMPDVSIIIPTYNRRYVLGRAIESALGQTFRDFELIIVDDASTDETQTLVQGYNDPRVINIRHSINKGAPAARNTGLRTARGEFIAFLDSDNEWYPARIEKQLELFSRLPASVGVVYADNIVVDESNSVIGEWKFGLRGNLYREFLQRPFMDFITPLIRAECFRKIGPMDEKVPSYQEWDTFLRISEFFEFDFVPEILAVYHLHKHDRISKNPLDEAAGWSYVYRKHRTRMLATLSRRVLIEHHRNLARLCRDGGAYGRYCYHVILSKYYASA